MVRDKCKLFQFFIVHHNHKTKTGITQARFRIMGRKNTISMAMQRRRRNTINDSINLLAYFCGETFESLNPVHVCQLNII